MNKKHIFAVCIGLLFVFIGLTGCIQDKASNIEITSNGFTMSINSAQKPMKLTVMGNNNDITIDQAVNVTHIGFTWGTQENIVRVSYLHNFTVDKQGERNNIVYYDQNTTTGGNNT